MTTNTSVAIGLHWNVGSKVTGACLVTAPASGTVPGSEWTLHSYLLNKWMNVFGEYLCKFICRIYFSGVKWCSLSPACPHFFKKIFKHFRWFYFLMFIIIYFIFWLCCAACGILVPQPGIEPTPPAVEVRSLNHWTAGEIPCPHFEVA